MNREILAAHLAAAEAEGRALTDGEAALIEAIASTPDPERLHPAAYADVTPALPRVQAAPAPDTHGALVKMLDSIHSRTPFVSATVAHYSTTQTLGVPSPVTGRLVDWLMGRGAQSLGGEARTFQVPKIKSGDAGKWDFPSVKPEIVTELASVPSTVHAAYTQVTSTSALDVPGLEMIINGMLRRRVVAVENTEIAKSIAAQVGKATTATTPEAAITDAVLAASTIGVGTVVAMLSPDVASAVMASGAVGWLGDTRVFQGMVVGVPFVVVNGLAAGTAVAVDTRAVALAFTPVMALTDPYSGSTSNVVTIRVETSTAAVVTDPTAVGVATVTKAARA